MFGDFDISSSFGPDAFGPSSIAQQSSARTSVSKNVTQNIEIKENRIPVQQINTSPFAGYDSCFIYISKCVNLPIHSLNTRKNGQYRGFRRMYMKIRLNPTVPIWTSKKFICSDPDPVLNDGCIYDIRNVMPDDFQNYVPTIELYDCTVDGKEELIGISLLVLKLKEVRQCEGKPMAFFMKGEQINFQNYADKTKKAVAGAVITVAFGFPNQQKYLQHNETVFSDLKTTSTSIQQQQFKQQVHISQKQTNEFAIDGDEQEYQKPIRKKVIRKQKDDESDDDDYESEGLRRRGHRKHHHHHQKREQPMAWVEKAIMLGWKPPGTVEKIDWKAKARDKGWRPPDSTIYSSIGVCADPVTSCKKTCETQTEDFVIDEKYSRKPPSSPTEEESSYDVADLLKILNPPAKKGSNNANLSLDISYDSHSDLSICDPIVSNFPEKKATKPELKLMKPLEIFAVNEDKHMILDSDTSYNSTSDAYEFTAGITHQLLRNLPESSSSSDEFYEKPLPEKLKPRSKAKPKPKKEINFDQIEDPDSNSDIDDFLSKLNINPKTQNSQSVKLNPLDLDISDSSSLDEDISSALEDEKSRSFLDSSDDDEEEETSDSDDDARIANLVGNRVNKIGYRGGFD